MNDKQRNQVNRLIRVKKFMTTHAPKFTNTPAKPGDAKFNASLAAVGPLREQIRTHQTTQASGAFHQETTNQEQERLDVRNLMSQINRTAAAVALDLDDPGIMDRFRIPPNGSDAQLVTAARAFAAAITELNLAAGFADHGYEGDPVADLIAEAEDVEETEGDQGGALGEQKGATESLPVLLKQARVLVQCVDTIIKNRFRNDPAMLGEWKVASHVTATPGNEEEEEPPPAPPTP